jgi:hypothetical protein
MHNLVDSFSGLHGRAWRNLGKRGHLDGLGLSGSAVQDFCEDMD